MSYSLACRPVARGPTSAATGPAARAPARVRSAPAARPRHSVIASAGKGDGKEDFGDSLLDFMYAGRKLRRWYGAEGLVLPKDGGQEQQGREPEQPEEADEEAGPRDTVVVLDADSSPMAEQVVLQLILKRAKVRAVVRDAAAAKLAFGPYVEAAQGDSRDASTLRRTLRGARAVVACGPLGVLPALAAAARLPHVVLLSSVGSPTRGFFSFGGGEGAVLGDAGREAALEKASSSGSGLRVTVVRVGTLTDTPGGSAQLALAAGSRAAPGSISREDAARVLAEAAEWERGSSGVLVLQAAAAGPGEPPADYAAAFEALAAATAT